MWWWGRIIERFGCYDVIHEMTVFLQARIKAKPLIRMTYSSNGYKSRYHQQLQQQQQAQVGVGSSGTRQLFSNVVYKSFVCWATRTSIVKGSQVLLKCFYLMFPEKVFGKRSCCLCSSASNIAFRDCDDWINLYMYIYPICIYKNFSAC
jgi:hypothetical protein